MPTGSISSSTSCGTGSVGRRTLASSGGLGASRGSWTLLESRRGAEGF